MQSETNNYQKILFKYYSDVLEELTVETMWAEIIDEKNGIYKLDNIPFYGPLIASGDEFYAEFDDLEQMLTYRRTTKCSGNSIVLVSITSEGLDKEIIRDQFKLLNCTSEGANDAYFSMKILEATDYAAIKNILDEYEQGGILAYAEPCLSEKHQTDIS